jgi:uncharacterized protein HemY
LLVFDLDHFKSVNDAFGHARGDEALVEVARRVEQEIRASDRLGYLATHQGAYGQAMPFFAESLKLYRTEADRQLLTSVLAGCAELRRAQGQFEPAAAYWHMSRRTPSRRSAHLSPL